MRILDLLKRNLKQNKSLILDVDISRWPEQLVSQFGIDEEFKRFQEQIEQLKPDITASLKAFTNEDILAAIPDRARTMNALHGKEYMNQVQRLLQIATFNNLFEFEQQQTAFFEHNNNFKDLTAKNISALKEFMHDEQKTTQTLLQQLEDVIITTAKSFEEKRFPEVRRLRDLYRKRKELIERTDKYQQLCTSLENDLNKTQGKKNKLIDEIKTQQALIRNENALHALEKLAKLEDEMHVLLAQYRVLAEEVKSFYKKHSDLSFAPKTKYVFDELTKDAASFIPTNAEKIKESFDAVVSQFEDEQLNNVRRLLERLAKLSKSVEQDARVVETSGPDQRALKKEMMRDIAALQVYDKQQFLRRAQTEEEQINKKIGFLQEELDPKRLAEMQEEMKNIARSFGATLSEQKVQDKGV